MFGHWAALFPLPSCAGSSPIDAASLGVWALQFTPRVAVLEDSVVAEVSASARLFGGMEPLHALIETGAAELGVRVAWAPSSIAALTLVRRGRTAAQCDGFRIPLPKILDPLPLDAIAAVRAHQSTLTYLGCRTLGDVRKFPRAGLSCRFDEVFLAALDQAYGLRPEVYAWLVLPESFHARLELMSRVDTAPALLFGARRLLVQMAGWLSARRLGARAFTLRWCHDVMRAKEAGAGGEITVRTAQATQDVEHFARLLAEHLARVELQAPAGAIELLVAEVSKIPRDKGLLLPEAPLKGAATELALERIQARLGDECLRRPTWVADHRLERMQRWSSKPTQREPTNCLYELPLPTWVLDEPLRLVERDSRPCYQGPLELLLGPSRVEGGWWHRSEGEDAPLPPNVQRDYWLAVSPRAGVLWVFQQRLAQDQTAWFLHGHFA